MDQVVNQIADQIVFYFCPLILFPELMNTEFNILNNFRLVNLFMRLANLFMRLANLFIRLVIISELFTMNKAQWTNKPN